MPAKNKPGDPLSPKQKEVLEFIIWYRTQNDGASPTLREIGGAFGIVVGSIQTIFRGLVRKGFITHQKGVARKIIVLRKP